MRQPKPAKKDGAQQVDRAIGYMEELAAFEKFKSDVLPLLRDDIEQKTSGPEMRKKYLALLTARLITIGLTDRDSAKALAACKDLLDREEGKAVERISTTHKLERLKDEELDALLKSEIEDLEDMLPN